MSSGGGRGRRRRRSGMSPREQLIRGAWRGAAAAPAPAGSTLSPVPESPPPTRPARCTPAWSAARTSCAPRRQPRASCAARWSGCGRTMRSCRASTRRRSATAPAASASARWRWAHRGRGWAVSKWGRRPLHGQWAGTGRRRRAYGCAQCVAAQAAKLLPLLSQRTTPCLTPLPAPHSGWHPQQGIPKQQHCPHLQPHPCARAPTWPDSRQDMLKQQDWKIERLARDNRALEAANSELRQRVDAVREENLQVGGGGFGWGVEWGGLRVLVGTGLQGLGGRYARTHARLLPCTLRRRACADVALVGWAGSHHGACLALRRGRCTRTSLGKGSWTFPCAPPPLPIPACAPSSSA